MTLLSALQRADVWPPYSCRQGFCGIPCQPGCFDGHVDHCDTLLTEPERADGMMLICIRRAAKGQRLTLDLQLRAAAQLGPAAGVPSPVENSASLWVDSPSDTTDRVNSTSVR